MKKLNGDLPVAMCKYCGELMGMSNGGVRLPLFDLPDEEKLELRQDLESILKRT